MHHHRICALAYLMTLLATVPAGGQMMSPQDESAGNQLTANDSAAEGADVVGYDRVRDILRKRCVTCHNLDELRGDLNLSDLTGIRAGSGSGPVVVAGQPNRSPLYTTAAHLEEPTMPPNSQPLPARELDLLRRWIEGGLAEKSGAVASKPEQTVAPEPTAVAGEGFVAIKPLFQPTAITALATHPTRPLAALAGEQQVVLVDAQSGELLKAVDFPEGDVSALTFAQDGSWLLAAGGVAGLSGRVVGFDVETGRRVFELADENDTILGLDISPDKQWVAVGGPAKVVRIYRVQDGSVVHTLRKHTDWVLTVRFSPDGLLLASGDRFGGLFIWNPATGEEFHVLRGHNGPVNAASWDGGSETLVTGGDDGQLRIWNMHHGELSTTWDAGVGAILGLDCRNGKTVVGGRGSSVAAWQGPELLLGSFATSEQIERVVWIGDQVLAGDAVGELHHLDGSLQAVGRYTLPVGQEQVSALLVRLERAEDRYQEELALRQSAADAVAAAAETRAAQEAAVATAGELVTVEPGSIAMSTATATANASPAVTARVVVAPSEALTASHAAESLPTAIQAQIGFLQASQTRLAELERATAASLEATVASLAELHALQRSLREQQQLHRQLLQALEQSQVQQQ